MPQSTCCTHSQCTTYTDHPSGLCAGHRPPEHGPKIGAFTNRWRQREVTIYAHPTDPARVITCGAPFGAAPAIWTDEPRSIYARYIGRFDAVYE